MLELELRFQSFRVSKPLLVFQSPLPTQTLTLQLKANIDKLMDNGVRPNPALASMLGRGGAAPSAQREEGSKGKGRVVDGGRGASHFKA